MLAPTRRLRRLVLCLKLPCRWLGLLMAKDIFTAVLGLEFRLGLMLAWLPSNISDWIKDFLSSRHSIEIRFGAFN